MTNGYRFKCPNCGGEFNEPARDPTGTSIKTAKCPWCGREMAVY